MNIHNKALASLLAAFLAGLIVLVGPDLLAGANGTIAWAAAGHAALVSVLTYAISWGTHYVLSGDGAPPPLPQVGPGTNPPRPPSR